MANDQFRKFMSPDFQASSQPVMDWMPWDQNNDAANMGSIVDLLKPKLQQQSPMTKGGGMPGMEGKGMMPTGKGGGASSL